MPREITFFMLVTERDCVIADYAIRSYQKIYESDLKFGGKDFTLFIYLNCLSEASKRKYLSGWESLPYTTLFDNAEKVRSMKALRPGEEIISPEGVVRQRDDFAESYDELWTTELKKFNTPFIATADADFEILNSDFYFDLMRKLEKDSSAIAASSDFSETKRLYETYSKREIVLNQRNHTWFCIYKKEAFQKSPASHFYHEAKNAEGELICYDSAAFFQQQLRDKNYIFLSSAPAYQSSFVHYGATSKNRSLTSENIGEYRKAFLLVTVGLFHGKTNLITRMLNKISKYIAIRWYAKYLSVYTKERSVYIYDAADQVQ